MNKLSFIKTSHDDMLAQFYAMKDEVLDDADISNIMPDMWARGKLRDPQPKAQIALRVGADVHGDATRQCEMSWSFVKRPPLAGAALICTTDSIFMRAL